MSVFTENELKAIEALRAELVDLDLDEEKNSGPYLIKWLRAQNLDIGQAEEMLRKSLIWRAENKVDEVLSWEIPQSFQPLIDATTRVSGYDSDGNAVVVTKLKDTQTAVVDQANKNDLIKCRIYMIEKILDAMRRRNEPLSLAGNQCITILDMDGFNLFGAIAMSRKRYQVLKETTDISDNHYPEAKKKVFVLNAPRMITVVMSLAKLFLQKETLKRTRIFGTNMNDWKAEILEHVPAAALPSKYGGMNSDFD